MTQQIQLTKGHVALIDDEDYAYVSQFSWCAQECRHTAYAERGIMVNGKCKTILMHRELAGVYAKGMLVDHKNHNGLDNRRCNLRAATFSQNAANNRGRGPKSKNKYKGVRQTESGRWQARCGKYNAIFDTEMEAAFAYNKEALRLFGEFASLNSLEEAIHGNCNPATANSVVADAADQTAVPF